jgi:hypothetical protein
MLQLIAPCREKKKELLKHKDYIHDVLAEGGRKAQAAASITLGKVKEAMGI